MARELQKAGWPNARALQGGWNLWQEAGMPIEPRGTPHSIDEKSRFV
ncbi:MAG TPA: hypothetical protein VFN35_10315 [Ktedonobacteraceae bacterium]|nr:hypothetical protein [Ktedonobacteraceae bacterium]